MKVSPHFNRYLIYSSLSNTICGFESIISSYSMLHASGIGIENTVLTSVSLNLLGKDILGQVFSIPFISRFSKYGDKDPIKYIRNNIILFETANFIECSTPFFMGSMFIPLATLGNIGKNIGFTGMGSFNANAINKLSIDKDNIIELYSKISVVNTFSYSFGMSLGLIFVTYLPQVELRLTILPFTAFLRYIFVKKSIEKLI